MNILLWVVQGLLAALYLAGGATKLFMFEKLAQVASTRALPYGLWMAIGVFEVLCALGIVLPAAIRTRPSLTAVAAICLAVEGVLFAGLHAAYGERSPMVFSIVSAVLAAFVAYGRLVLKPL